MLDTREAGRGALQALAFLTILPLPASAFAPPTPAPAPDPAGTFGAAPSNDGPSGGAPKTESTTEAAAWFPLVGALIGALAGAVRAATIPLLDRGPATVLAIIVATVITGALHQDGLADTADGLGVRGDRGRRLRVMRDSAIGSFGTLALIAWALLLYAAVSPFDGSGGFRALVTAGALSRAALVLHGYASPAARADGLGVGFAPSLEAVIAAGLSAAAIALLAGHPGPGAVALVVTSVLATAWIAFTGQAFGGRTGDTLGAIAVITEVAAALALLACQ